MGYILTSDYHTHTVFSHGKGTIRDNVTAARALGLKEIGIADHGPMHLEHGLRMDRVPEMRRIVTELNEEFDDINVYLSIEANLVYAGNGLDISKEECGLFDYIIAGYHNGVQGAYSKENWVDYNRGGYNRKLRRENTEMVLKALYENNVKILAHPGEKANIEMAEVAKACEETGTLIEINTQHRHPTAAEIEICAKTDARFVLSSDAHIPVDVGDVRIAMIRVREAGLDPERIVNIRYVEDDE